MAVTINKLSDRATAALRFVIGDRRLVMGTITGPTKYTENGETITAADLGFDQQIDQLIVGLPTGGKPLATFIRESSEKGKLKLFKALGEQFAKDSEEAKELEFPFIAIGK